MTISKMKNLYRRNNNNKLLNFKWMELVVGLIVTD